MNIYSEQVHGKGRELECSSKDSKACVLQNYTTIPVSWWDVFRLKKEK